MNKNNIHVLSRGIIIDKDYILLCKTIGLSNNFYFLPGGHVEHGESAEKALIRELMEEARASCRIKRFLGCLEYSFEPADDNKICHNHEYNFIFEIESDDLKSENQIPKLEDHIELTWVGLYELPNIDLKPEILKELLPDCLANPAVGIFRSVMI